MTKISGLVASLCAALVLAGCGSDSDGGGTAGSGNGNAGSGNGNAGSGNGNAGSGNGNAGSGSAGAPSGSGSAVAACKNLTHVVCEKFWSCFTAAQLEQAAELVGTSKADCETKIMDCTEEGTQCDPGTSFNSSNASKCVSDIGAYTCDQLLTIGDSDGPASCNSVCD